MSVVTSEAPVAVMGRKRLFAVLGGLYLAQAIPSYLFAAALPPIMREAGVSRTAIAYLSLWFLPLLLKFFWAPWVDRVRPFAQRAGWQRPAVADAAAVEHDQFDVASQGVVLQAVVGMYVASSRRGTVTASEHS